jgi:hypothetical protein
MTMVLSLSANTALFHFAFISVSPEPQNSAKRISRKVRKENKEKPSIRKDDLKTRQNLDNFPATGFNLFPSCFEDEGSGLPPRFDLALRDLERCLAMTIL